MVRKKMYQKIQRLKRRGLSKSEISYELGIDRTTVRKYYGMDPVKYRRYCSKRLGRRKSFDTFQGDIQEVYALNDSKRLNMAAVYDYLEERYGELPGNEQTLRNYIHHLMKRGALILERDRRSYDKVEALPYGKQLQIDFGEYKRRSYLKLYIFAAVLSASRYKYVAFQEKPFTTIDMIHHLLDCFDYIGGIPEELVIDQDSIMVSSENYGDIIYTEKFAGFIEEMRLKMYVCRKADPESKGKIENVIKYVKYNFLQVRDFESLREAQERLASWLKRRGNGKISQATKKVPFYEIEEERKYLRPLKNSLFRKDSLLGRELRGVSDKSYIMVDTNEYSVPVEYRNRDVEIYRTERELYIFDEKSRQQIAYHQISPFNGQRIKNNDHFRDKTLSIDELHEQTREMHPFAGWKEFVEINLKTYTRYSRDQCTLAGNHLSAVEDVSILKMAVDYCLENKTVSMRELIDTYEHMLDEHKEEEAAIHEAFFSLLRKDRVEGPVVSKRTVAEYETIIGTSRGGAG